MSDELPNGDGERLPNGLKNPHGLTKVELPDNSTNGPLRNPTSKPEPYRRCGAKRRNGQPCKAAAMPNGRCRCHGGLTPCGIASPHFKHGRRSRYLKDIPPALKAGYKASLRDPELHNMDEENALLTARIGELIRALGTGGDPDEIWTDLKDTINHKARLACQEHRRQVDLASLVPAESALAVFVAIMERTKSVLEERLEGQQSRKIMSEIARSIHDLLPGPTATVIDQRNRSSG